MDVLNPFNLFALVILIYSAILHEIAHGYVADRLGDPTARLLGRLTLDPRPHIDPLMSIVFPLLLIMSGSPVIFGGAKPVPIDSFNLRDGRKDLALVSLAGPLTNILLAILATLLIRIFFPHTSLLELTMFTGGRVLALLSDPVGLIGFFLGTTVKLNVLLAIFNLLPIPPLDGSKVFALLLSERQAYSYLALGKYGTFILLFLLLFPIGGISLQHILTGLYGFGLSLLGF